MHCQSNGSLLKPWIQALGVVVFSISITISCSHPCAIAQNVVPRILLGEETTDYESVGIVGSIQRGGFCSGTLIAPNHVLTAAHCAAVIEDEQSGTFDLDGDVYLTAEIFIHPDYNPRTLANDIAILRLSETVQNVTPLAIFRDLPIVGDLLFIVGFGGTGTADGGNDGSFGIKRVGVTTIDEVTDTMVNWIFDDASETNTAAGDSGGPGFIDIDGDLFVASVTSGGTNDDSSLGDFAFNTRVDAFADWIDLVVATTSVDPDPIVEPPVTDVGDCPAVTSSGDSGSSEYRPFPLLQWLVDQLIELLNLLLAELDLPPVTTTEPAPADPTEPAPADPTDPAPADPTEPAPADPTEPAPADPGFPTLPATTDPLDLTNLPDPTEPTAAAAIDPSWFLSKRRGPRFLARSPQRAPEGKSER